MNEIRLNRRTKLSKTQECLPVHSKVVCILVQFCLGQSKRTRTPFPGYFLHPTFFELLADKQAGNNVRSFY